MYTYNVQYVYPIANSEIAGAYESTFEGTFEVRKYFRKYESTKVRKYESTKVRKYESTFVSIFEGIISISGSTCTAVHVLYVYTHSIIH